MGITEFIIVRKYRTSDLKPRHSEGFELFLAAIREAGAADSAGTAHFDEILPFGELVVADLTGHLIIFDRDAGNGRS